MNNMRQAPSYRLDNVNQCLWRSSLNGTAERLSLPPKTFHVLRYLIENPDRLVTHDELLDAVWHDVHVQPEVLKSHILAVRNALGDKAESPRFIETLRGRGYRFIGPITKAGVADRQPDPALTSGIFVGRAPQLGELTTILQSVLKGKPEIVFIAGEPGIGKTALVDQFIGHARSVHRLQVSYGRCVEGFGGIEPYYPILEALGRLCKGPNGETVVRHLIEIAPTWAAQMSADIPQEKRGAIRQEIVGAGRGRMLREICELLDVLSAEHPLILVFEDLHWVDYSTVDLLSAIARRRSQCKLMVIATYRPEDAATSNHALKQISHELHLRKLCREIALGPLTESAVGRFLTGDMDLKLEVKEFAHLIRERSGGNPLFMQAILDDFEERGIVKRTASGWQLMTPPGEIRFQVPHTLGQVIESQIQRLTAEQRYMLETASIAGLYFSPTAIATAAGMGIQILEDMCEELSRRECFIRRSEIPSQLDTASIRQYRFKHAMYRQALYDHQGQVQRRRLHRSIGEQLELLFDSEPRSETVVELVEHFAAAGDWSKALTYVRFALQTAKTRSAYRDALAILDRATELAVNLPEAERCAAELDFLERRASIYFLAQDPRAEATYAQLVEKAALYGDINIHVRSLLGLGQTTSWRDLKSCLRIFDQALQKSALQTDVQLRAVTQTSLYARRIWAAGWSVDDALKCETALVPLRNGADPLLAARGLIEYSMICLLSARYREAHDIFRTNYDVLLNHIENRTEFDLNRKIWLNLFGIPWSLLFLGDFGGALKEFDVGIAALFKNGNYGAARAHTLYRALFLFHVMDFAGVVDVCKTFAVPDGEEGDYDEVRTIATLPSEQRLCLMLQGLGEAGLGNRDAALKYLTEAECHMDRQPVTLDWYWRLTLEWAQVCLLIASGDLTSAKARSDRFVSMAERTEERTWRALAWDTQARISLKLGATTEALDHIGKAFAAANEFETPLADWRIHATAAAVHRAVGDAPTANMHAQLHAQKKRQLAETLPEGHHLRKTFERPHTSLFAELPVL